MIYSLTYYDVAVKFRVFDRFVYQKFKKQFVFAVTNKSKFNYVTDQRSLTGPCKQ